MKKKQNIVVESSQKYFDDLLLAFPQLNDEVDRDLGVHYNMERFADYTIMQIKDSNFDELKKCFSFQEQKMVTINPEIENALMLSYCESLLLGEVGSQMLRVTKYMGPKLFTMYKDYHDYYSNLSKNQ